MLYYMFYQMNLPGQQYFQQSFPQIKCIRRKSYRKRLQYVINQIKSVRRQSY